MSTLKITVPPLTDCHYTGAVTLRVYYARPFIDDQGNQVMGGPVGSSAFFVEYPCGLAAGVLTVPDLVLTTSDQVRAHLFDEVQVSAVFFRGSTQLDYLFQDFILPKIFVPQVSLSDLTVWNDAMVLTYPSRYYLDRNQILLLLRTFAALNTSTYITQTPDPVLTNEQALSTLATGILKNTTGTGVLTIALPGTDYVLPGPIGTLGITMNSSRLLGRVSPGAGSLEEIQLGTNLSFAGNVLNATGGSGGGVSPNPTSNVMPIQRGGTFVDSRISDDLTTLGIGGVNSAVVIGDYSLPAQGMQLEIRKATGSQLRLTANAAAYTDLTVSATAGGFFTVNSQGSVEFNTVGRFVGPQTNYTEDLGSLTKKWRSLYAGNLFVETLVAQNTIATIGGRILVGPTTNLVLDVAPGGTSIRVKHNQMVSGDIAVLQANGFTEFMAMTSNAIPVVVNSITYYDYTVTRNLDGSGAKQWYAGDAVFNTGQVGYGFIDLYSLYGLKSSYLPPGDSLIQAGPTIVGNVRSTMAYAGWSEYWAIGNLQNLYGYPNTVYGLGLGQYAVSGTTYITIDSLPATGTTGGGYKVHFGSTIRMQFLNNGSGFLANGNISWDVSGNAVIAGWAINAASISSTGVTLASGVNAGLGFGTPPPTSSNPALGTGIWLDKTGLYGMGGGQVQAKLSATTGQITAGGTAVTLDINGITMAAGNVATSMLKWGVNDISAPAVIWGSNPSGQATIWVGSRIQAGSPTAFGRAYLVATTNNNGAETHIALNQNGPSASVYPNKGYAHVSTPGLGMVISSTDQDASLAPFVSAILELRSTTGALVLPRLTTAQRNALGIIDGMLIFNTDTKQLQSWLVTTATPVGAWVPLLTAGDVNGSMYFPSTANLFFYVPTNGQRNGVVYVSTATNTGMGLLSARSDPNGHSYVSLDSNAPSGGVSTSAVLDMHAQDNSNQQSIGFQIVAELNIGSYSCMWPLNGTFKGLVVGAAVVPTPGVVLQLESTTGALLLPRMTQAQVTAVPGTDGMLLYNSGRGTFQGRSLGQWRDLMSTVAVKASSSAASFTVPSGATTPINFDFTWFDTDVMHQNGAMPRLTCKVAGIYLIQGALTIAGDGTGAGYRQLQLKLNGTALLDTDFDGHPAPGLPTGLAADTIWALNVGDYVELHVYQNSGVALSINGSNGATDFSGVYLSMIKVG